MTGYDSPLLCFGIAWCLLSMTASYRTRPYLPTGMTVLWFHCRHHLLEQSCLGHPGRDVNFKLLVFDSQFVNIGFVWIWSNNLWQPILSIHSYKIRFLVPFLLPTTILWDKTRAMNGNASGSSPKTVKLVFGATKWTSCHGRTRCYLRTRLSKRDFVRFSFVCGVVGNCPRNLDAGMSWVLSGSRGGLMIGYPNISD